MDQALLDYIQKARAAGMTDDQIYQNLTETGWQSEVIKSTLNGSVASVSSPTTTPAAAVASDMDQAAFIKKWSWGGFLLYVIYFLASRMYKTAVLYFLAGLVPFLNIWLWIKSGLRGRQMVWASGKWGDFESFKRRQKLLDKIGIVAFSAAVFLLYLSIAGFVFGLMSKNNVSQNGEKQTTAVTPTVAQDLSPAGQVKSTVLKIIASKDEASFRQLLTKDSVKMLDQLSQAFAKDGQPSSFDFVKDTGLANVDVASLNVVLDENNTKAKIITESANVDGNKTQEVMYFALEDDAWKFDLAKTFNEQIQTATNEFDSTPEIPAGPVDLAVLDFQISPKSPTIPSYSDKTVKIEARVKNLSNYTFKRFDYEYSINQLKSPGKLVQVIKPGQIVRVDFFLHQGYDFEAKYKNYKTGAGDYTFSIIVDPKNNLKDPDRSNNQLSKLIQFSQ